MLYLTYMYMYRHAKGCLKHLKTSTSLELLSEELKVRASSGEE